MSRPTDRIRNIGAQPQAFDIALATNDDTNIRSVASSRQILQVTLISSPVGGESGVAAHRATVQLQSLDRGTGQEQLKATDDQLTFETELSNG
jgi:hypothetical protein